MELSTNTGLENIKGVGPKTAEQLELAQLKTVADLLHHLPFRYEDFSEVSRIADIKPGKNTIKAKVESVEVRRVRRAMTVTTATLVDDSGKLKAVWFNQPYRAAQLKGGGDFFFSGNFEFRYNKYQLSQPSAEKVSDMPIQTDRILPIYRLVKGLKNQTLRKVLTELKPLMTMLPETLPTWMIKQAKLISHAEAVEALHFPESIDEIDRARQRIAFEELLPLMLASNYSRQANNQLQAPAIEFDAEAMQRFVAKLPFELTDDQRRSAWDIVQDMQRQTPMNRMLQGDVGSGKTIVAGMAAYLAALSGYQSAFMAPTEILAQQHAESLSKLLEPFGVTVGLLTGSVKAQARQQLNKQIKDGAVAVVIGTHALIQDSVEFNNLGLAVIDEQHRFGVAQRQSLLSKSVKSPHVLAMTATPIPRSLQLTVFGELDVSIIRSRPKSRLPIRTKIVSPATVKDTYAEIDKQIEQGRQVYVICALIDDSAVSDKKSVESEYRKLKNSVFGHRNIGLLHGRMKSDEKEQVMRDFKDKKYDILVSTTVVEVGVDVPNATAIMIENADQFGLAQLHQLRGRVGRGVDQSYCYLVMSDHSKPSQRLREVEKSTDGFHLAEVDLRLRGPGEIYGRSQHGDLDLRIATLTDTELTNSVNQAAQEFVRSRESIDSYPELKNRVDHYLRLTMLN